MYKPGVAILALVVLAAVAEAATKLADAKVTQKVYFDIGMIIKTGS